MSTTSIPRRRRIRLLVTGLVVAMLATVVPAAPAAAATNVRVLISNNCGSWAPFYVYRPNSGVMYTGGSVSPGNTVGIYLSTGTTWRFVLPRGTTYVTPNTYYTFTVAMC